MQILFLIFIILLVFYTLNLMIEFWIERKLKPLLNALSKYQNAVAKYISFSKEYHNLYSNTNPNKKKLAIVKAKFDSFQELTLKQLNLIGQLDQPSSNASYSRFKNSLRQEIKSMEQEKINILQSILDEGFDSKVTVITPDGETTKKRISEIVQTLAEGLGDSKINTDSKSPKNKITRLQLVKEKNDDTNDPEIH